MDVVVMSEEIPWDFARSFELAVLPDHRLNLFDERIFGVVARNFESSVVCVLKGFGVIHRFSEDIDIRIEPFDGLQVDTNPNHEKPQHIESRRQFFDKLRDKIKIPGITAVERDTTYDDETLRNAGLRLRYETHFGSIPGLNDGILLEVGFDQTAPNRAVPISSWVVQFADSKKLQ